MKLRTWKKRVKWLKIPDALRRLKRYLKLDLKKRNFDEKEYEKQYKNHRKRLAVGVSMIATFWTRADGSVDDFVRFCRKNFLTEERDLQALLDTTTKNFEQFLGMGLDLFRTMHRPLDIETGEPVSRWDKLFTRIDPFWWIWGEMLFQSKIAFVLLLNFESRSTQVLIADEEKLTRRQWIETRLTDLLRSREPSRIARKELEAYLDASSYITDYVIHSGCLIDGAGESIFAEAKELPSHWGLRDEICAQYHQPMGAERQETLYRVMKRIIAQEVPKIVIDNPGVLWDVKTNKVFTPPGDDGVLLESESKDSAPEPDTRYDHLRRAYLAERVTDKYYGDDFLDRSFLDGAEIPENVIQEMLKTVLTSPLAKRVATVVQKRLGRDLRPFDIWYNKFVHYDEKALDQIVRAKYPNIDAFAADIPRILRMMGFAPEKADFIASRIQVDNSRTSGHAWGALRREDKSFLRTRCPPDGMDFQGFSVGIHELGHCSEQVITLNDTDNYLLSGLPNTGISEAFAFFFERQSTELLGVKQHIEFEEEFGALERFWDAFEIAGVSLLDINTWHWMYQYKDFPPSMLKDAIRQNARDIWNQYFAPVIGVKDEDILAIYSHPICYALYMPYYSIGATASAQILEYCRDKHWPTEMERMCKIGMLTPYVWMKQAVGARLDLTSLFKAAEDALRKIKIK